MARSDRSWAPQKPHCASQTQHGRPLMRSTLGASLLTRCLSTRRPGTLRSSRTRRLSQSLDSSRSHRSTHRLQCAVATVGNRLAWHSHFMTRRQCCLLSSKRMTIKRQAIHSQARVARSLRRRTCRATMACESKQALTELQLHIICTSASLLNSGSCRSWTSFTDSARLC